MPGDYALDDLTREAARGSQFASAGQIMPPPSSPGLKPGR